MAAGAGADAGRQEADARAAVRRPAVRRRDRRHDDDRASRCLQRQGKTRPGVAAQARELAAGVRSGMTDRERLLDERWPTRPPPAPATKHGLDQRHAPRAGTAHAPAPEVMMMSLTEPHRQALGAIADGLAGSDPRLASMLTIFSQLAAGEEMPAREKTRVRRRRPAVLRPRRARYPRRGTAFPQPRRRYARLGWQQAMLVLGAVISAALLTAALVLNASGHKVCVRPMGTACPSPSITRMPARANANAPRAVSMSVNAKGAGRA